MAKQLKLWNGRPYAVLPHKDWKNAHVYVAAFSVQDVRRVCLEAGMSAPSTNEINKYWSKCWGNSMNEITPERGLWAIYEPYCKPVRILAKATNQQGNNHD